MNKIISKIQKFIKKPSKVVSYLLNKKYVGVFIPDKLFLKIKYRLEMGKKLNFKKPQSYNEKLQWIKLYERKPEYTKMVDKYEVRKYIADKIGAEYLIPLLGVWDDPDDIDFDALPDQFVLKCNHNSGLGMCICKDKSKLDIDKVKKDLRRALKENYYLKNREWPYKNVKRKIIAEKYMVDESGTELKDYKLFCFGGQPELLFVATDRQIDDTKFDFFDMQFNHLPFLNGHPNANKEIKRPQGLEEMAKLAEILSEGIPHARIDFYDINGKVYFGEITFFHWSGLVPFEPEEWDYKLGDMLNIEKN